jgi:hypothetical protein
VLHFQTRVLGQLLGYERTMTGFGGALNTEEEDYLDILRQAVEEVFRGEMCKVLILIGCDKGGIQLRTLSFGRFLAFVSGILGLA